MPERRNPTEEDHATIRQLSIAAKKAEKFYTAHWNAYLKMMIANTHDAKSMDTQRLNLVTAFEAFIDTITTFESYYIKNGLVWMR